MSENTIGKLILTRPEGTEEEFTITASETTVGSDNACDVVIKGLRVSKTHARIVYQDERCTITDLNSSRGTRVNGVRVKETTLLRNGDLIQLGNATLRFESAASTAATVAPEAADEQSDDAHAGERAELLRALQATDLFGTLDAAHLRALTAEVSVLTLAPDQTLMQQGEVGDALFVVLDGRLRVLIEDEERETRFRRFVGAHETIGEISLLTGQTRTATAVADGAVRVARLTRDRFEQLATASPTTADALAAAITELIRRRQLRTALNATPLFQEMDHKLRQAAEAELTLISLRSGEKLFGQGDAGDGMYVLVSGRLRVVLEDVEKSPRVLRELGRGESFGEIALLTEQPRTASVYAIRDTELAKLSRESYARLVSRFPGTTTRTFTQPITELVVSRDRRQRSQAETTLSLALIPARPDVLLTEFAQRLARAFSRLGSTRHLSSRRVDASLGKVGVAQTALSQKQNQGAAARDALEAQLVNWLGELEAEHRFLLYEADPALTPWTRRAVRQADHILIVGHGPDDPKQSELEMALNQEAERSITKQQSLVLLHRGGQRTATGTARWLAERSVQDYYHVRWQEGDNDLARLARVLAGQAVGLVLSGGGARGAAHLGVLRALEEADIAVDLIGGVSVGSLVGALYAMGDEVQTIQDKFGELMENARLLRVLSDVTLPVVALTTGHSTAKMIGQLFGDAQIEDLFLPYFCGSANLSQARDHVHCKGPIWQAVRASGCVPGILPPLVHDGDLLIDGGLYNNLPLDAMRARNPHGPVIGVDVMAASDLDNVASYGTGLSGWRALADLLTPWRRQRAMPNIASLLVRTLEVSSVQSVQDHLAAGLADLYLRPPVSHFSFFESEGLDQIVRIGYRCAKEQLASWQLINGRLEPVAVLD